MVNHFIKHFSSESKKQQEGNYREFSPTHAVTYVALSIKLNGQNGCQCGSLACTSSITSSITCSYMEKTYNMRMCEYIVPSRCA